MQTEGNKNELPERMLGVKDVASILSFHPGTVRRWERERLLKVIFLISFVSLRRRCIWNIDE
jgi:hypothetical protein